MKESLTFETAGEGSYATMDVPQNTVFVLYGGMLYNEQQSKILNERTKQKRLDHGWNPYDPEAVELWKYR